MKVRELMRARCLRAREDEDLGRARQMMLWTGTRHLPVVRGGQVVGVLSERDLLRHADRASVREAMSSPVEVIGPDADVADAAARMLEHRIGCLPVVDAGALVGIVTTTDLLRHAARAPTVDEVMSRSLLAVTPATGLLEAAALMRERGVRHLPVVDPARRVLGILSDRDVRSALGDPDEPDARARDLKVAHAMTHDVSTVPEGTPLTEAAERLIDRRVGAVPVVDAGGQLVGMVSYADILRRPPEV